MKEKLISKILEAENSGLHSIDYDEQDQSEGYAYLQTLTIPQLRTILRTYTN